MYTMNFDINSNIDIESSIEADESFSGAYKLKLFWGTKQISPEDSVTIELKYPMKNIMNVWLPNSVPLKELPRAIKADWVGKPNLYSSIASSAPILCFYDNSDVNRLTIALSETKKRVNIDFGVIEKEAALKISFNIPLAQYSGASGTELCIYTDESELPMYKAVAAVSEWWENKIGIKPMRVPECAFEPLYSFWYSFHQDIFEKEVEAECQRAAALGFKNVIVDDGWQTDDNNGGYAYCGDWKPCKAKISDFAEHVKKVHDMGLKYMLWYSVPFVGRKSENWDKFKDKLLYFDDSFGAGVLDPRYAEVREFLISIYKNALLERDLDGFKLDFIDSFVNINNIPPNGEMDIPDLQDAIDKLMTDIRDELMSIKKDVLIEFRQTYIGPNIRKYGNMLRAADCPYDYLTNRTATLDLRLTSGHTAVHSDMLMWSADESAETAAMQIINCIFSVVQISVKLDKIPENHRKMLRFWVWFMSQNKDLLLKSNIAVFEPHLYYTAAKAYDDDKEIIAVYANDKCVDIERTSAVVINGTAKQNVICRFGDSRERKLTILDCMGKIVYEGTFEPEGIQSIAVPVSGMAVIGDFEIRG